MNYLDTTFGLPKWVCFNTALQSTTEHYGCILFCVLRVLEFLSPVGRGLCHPTAIRISTEFLSNSLLEEDDKII